MSDIAKKSLETFVVRIAMQAVSVAGGIVIARELGASGKGIFSFAATVLGTIVMLYAGQSAAISWQYGKQRRNAQDVLRATMKLFVASAVPLTIALTAIAILVPSQRSLLPVALAVPCALFVQMTTGFFLADSDVRAINIQQAFPTIVATAIFVPLLFLIHAGVQSVLYVWAISYVLAAVYSALHLAPRLHVPPAGDPPGLLREQIRYGSQISLSSVVSYLNFRIDVFLVLFFLGQTALGVYSVGIAVGELMFQISRPLVTAAFGRIARSDERESALLTAKCLRHTLLLVIAASIFVFFAAPPLLVLLYGKQFAGAAPVVRLLLPGVVAYSMMPILAAFFSQQLGTPRIPLMFSAFSTIVCAVLTAATLGTLGIAGGAIATSLSYSAAFTLALLYFCRRTGLRIVSIFTIGAEDLVPYRRLIASTFAYFSKHATR